MTVSSAAITAQQRVTAGDERQCSDIHLCAAVEGSSVVRDTGGNGKVGPPQDPARPTMGTKVSWSCENPKAPFVFLGGQQEGPAGTLYKAPQGTPLRAPRGPSASVQLLSTPGDANQALEAASRPPKPTRNYFPTQISTHRNPKWEKREWKIRQLRKRKESNASYEQSAPPFQVHRAATKSVHKVDHRRTNQRAPNVSMPSRRPAAIGQPQWCHATPAAALRAQSERIPRKPAAAGGP